jgi:hypothetical protein
LLRPEPDPLGASLEPLGDELGPTVLPDGFMLVLDPLLDPGVVPVELPLPLNVLPLEPVVPELMPAEPPAPAPVPPPAPPPVPPPACASANVLDSANAVVNAIVLNFMRFPLS